MLIISNDKEQKDKRTKILSIVKDSKALQPKDYKIILKGPLFKYLKYARGIFISSLLKMAIKIYFFFKKDLFAEEKED